MPVEHIPYSSVPVEHIPYSSVPVEHIPNSSVPVEHICNSSMTVEHIPYSSVPVEHIRNSSVPVEHIPNSSVPVEHICNSSVPVEHSSDPYSTLLLPSAQQLITLTFCWTNNGRTDGRTVCADRIVWFVCCLYLLFCSDCATADVPTHNVISNTPKPCFSHRTRDSSATSVCLLKVLRAVEVL